MKSVMTHMFSQVPGVNLQRSTFNRSCGFKTTFDAGYLVPIFTDDVVPGDTFQLKMSAFARLATPIVPFMDNMFLDTFFFFVPNRLIWNNWEKFNGAQTDPGDSTDFLIPQIPAPSGTGWAIGSLGDYFGLPTLTTGYSVDSLHFRAYNLIWNEWFRDQNLQDSVVVDKDDGPDNSADYVLLRRGKRHDYFTSCLPWPQKGDAVQLPLGTTAPVIANNDTPLFKDAATGLITRPLSMVASGAEVLWNPAPGVPGGTNAKWTDTTGLQADLSDATAATINQLRQAFQIQKIYERDARGGTRYTEIIRAHFGVISPDARLQRPEYLGGGSSPVTIHPVAQTSETNETPQGNLAALGTVAASGHGFSKGFTEHGVIIGLACVRADLNYQQGLNRMWSRRTRWDYYWPELAHIGEQAVLKKEIMLTADPVSDEAVWGYNERYAEYRYKPSLITGKFRSTSPGSLDIWHLAQQFSSVPSLNATFIQENPPVDRVIATPEEPHFLFDSYFHLKCTRPMATYGVPGLIDHF